MRFAMCGPPRRHAKGSTNAFHGFFPRNMGHETRHRSSTQLTKLATWPQWALRVDSSTRKEEPDIVVNRQISHQTSCIFGPYHSPRFTFLNDRIACASDAVEGSTVVKIGRSTKKSAMSFCALRLAFQTKLDRVRTCGTMFGQAYGCENTETRRTVSIAAQTQVFFLQMTMRHESSQLLGKANFMSFLHSCESSR